MTRGVVDSQSVCMCLVRDWLVGQLVGGGAGASRRHLQVTTALGATQGDQKVTTNLGLSFIPLHMVKWML